MTTLRGFSSDEEKGGPLRAVVSARSTESCAVAFLFVMVTLVATTQLRVLPSDLAFCSFRLCSLGLLWLWSIGCVDVVLSRTSIDHYSLLGLPRPTGPDSAVVYFKGVIGGSCSWLAVALFVVTLQGYEDLLPFRLDVVPVVFQHVGMFLLLSPFDMMGLGYRTVFHSSYVETFVAPMHPVSFRHIVAGDWLCSLVRVLVDYLRVVCMVFALFVPRMRALERVLWPLVTLFPSWCRLQQCVRRFLDTGLAHPNLTNAGKYTMSAIVLIFISMSIATVDTPLGYQYKRYWQYAIVASTAANFAWDLHMDWGVFDKNPKRHPVVFKYRSMYYVAVAVNLVLRASWAVEFLQLAKHYSVRRDTLDTTLAALEIMRRCIWTMLRVEQEYFSQVVYKPSLKVVHV